MTARDAILAAEWERIDLLGACLAAARQGEVPPDSMTSHLDSLHRRVLESRAHGPWREVTTRHELSPLDQDILACALAPEAEPRVGWMYQSLQGSAGSCYPSAGLIRELFVMDEARSAQLYSRLAARSPLVAAGLLQSTGGETFAPLRPTSRALAGLLGRPDASISCPPGSVRIAASGSFDKLVLPSFCMTALREFLLCVTCRDKVVREWGARSSGGPVALFAGPSGTGKTFAAEAIASALGWTLMRVDLGLLVSKYVGETEQNLNALFDAAHARDMVLLFDEADSLFGKRGDIKEARDRYANMEVSHLLTRMERHDGPCILTSNLRQHLDPAFARRFQSVVEFPRPQAVQRSELWRLHLPPGAPIAAEVDVVALGQALDLTGGQIRNAALYAAYLAAGEGAEIDLARIARAVWTELAKDGREVPPSRLGILAGQLPLEGLGAAH